MDLLQYWKQLAQEANLTPEDSEKVLKVLSDPKASETFQKEFIPRPTFHSQLDRQRDDLKKLYEDNYKQWYNEQVVPTLSAKDKELTAARAQVNAFESTYGKLEGVTQTQNPGVVQTQTGDFISKADFEALLRKRDQDLATNTVRVLKDVVRSALDHSQRFKEPLDLDAWEKFAVESNLPPGLAYEKFIEPRAKELDKQARIVEIQKAKEEAIKDYQTKNKLPVDTKPREISPLAAALKPTKEGKMPSTDSEKFDLFKEAWNEAQEASTA